MKTKITLDLEVKMGGAFPAGISLSGYMPDGTTYKDLVRVFGKPQRGLSADGKIKAEWTGSINGLVFTIYDYKSEAGPKGNTNWHIGGRTPLVAELLVAYLKICKQHEFYCKMPYGT